MPQKVPLASRASPMSKGPTGRQGRGLKRAPRASRTHRAPQGLIVGPHEGYPPDFIRVSLLVGRSVSNWRGFPPPFRNRHYIGFLVVFFVACGPSISSLSSFQGQDRRSCGCGYIRGRTIPVSFGCSAERRHLSVGKAISWAPLCFNYLAVPCQMFRRTEARWL